MKKLIWLFSLTLLASGLFATDLDQLTIDRDEVLTQLNEMTVLQDFVEANEGATLSSIELESPQLLSEVEINTNLALSLGASSMEPLGIPAFAWGFCAGLPGIAVVFFVTEDDEETKMSIYGCVASSLIGTVLWLVLSFI